MTNATGFHELTVAATILLLCLCVLIGAFRAGYWVGMAKSEDTETFFILICGFGLIGLAILAFQRLAEISH